MVFRLLEGSFCSHVPQPDSVSVSGISIVWGSDVFRSFAIHLRSCCLWHGLRQRGWSCFLVLSYSQLFDEFWIRKNCQSRCYWRAFWSIAQFIKHRLQLLVRPVILVWSWMSPSETMVSVCQEPCGKARCNKAQCTGEMYMLMPRAAAIQAL